MRKDIPVTGTIVRCHSRSVFVLQRGFSMLTCGRSAEKAVMEHRLRIGREVSDG